MRSPRIDLRLLATFVAGIGLSACTVGEPGGYPNGPSVPKAPGAETDFKPPPPVDMAHADDGKPLPPVLDAIPQLTQYDTAPIHGTAPAGASVLITATDGSTVAADVETSGRFCANVPLQKAMVNQFSLRTIDGNGNQSDPVMLNIEQKGTATQQQPTGAPAQNMSIGGAAASSLSWDTGAIGDALDGNPTTYAGSWQSSSTTDYFVVAMSDRRSIDHIRLQAPSSCPLTSTFQLWVSNADAPSDPGTTPMAWTLVKTFNTGEAGTDATVTLGQATPLTHVALYFDRGWIAWGAADINCGNDWDGAYYAFSEIQAWSANNVVAPPPSSAPSCSSGSN